MKISILCADCSQCKELSKHFEEMFAALNLTIQIEEACGNPWDLKLGYYPHPNIFLGDRLIMVGRAPSQSEFLIILYDDVIL